MSDEKDVPIVLDKMADIVLKYRPKEKKKKPRKRATAEPKKGETGVKYITPEFNVSKDSAYWMLKKRGVTIRHRNPVDRFWAKVNITSGEDCWLWNAAVDRNGYGRASWVKANGIERYQQSWYAHRLAWYLTYNFVPDSPLEILHKCGIALCCNPDHLRVGTKAENLADRSFHRKVGHGPHVLEYYNNNILYKSP